MATKTVMMPRELTAENGAKALLSGEFIETTPVPCPDCEMDNPDDEDCCTCFGERELLQDVPVSWTTIKAIYSMAVEHLGT